MEQVRVELKGWKAIVLLVALLAVTSYRVYSRFRTVDEAGRDVLRAWLVNDYEGKGPSGLARRLVEYRAGMPARPEAPATAPQVEFASLSAHGLPGIMVVRAEISVNGGPPPDGRPVRYLSLTRKVEGGWMVFTETDPVRYYLVLLR